MTRLVIGAAVLLLAANSSADAASFDCGRARAADEVAICRSLELNDMDVRMATLFELTKGFVAMGQRAEMRDDQRAWLEQRRTCRAYVPCPRRSYRRRIAELEQVVADIKSRGPF